jgi:hypothetical protein
VVAAAPGKRAGLSPGRALEEEIPYPVQRVDDNGRIDTILSRSAGWLQNGQMNR